MYLQRSSTIFIGTTADSVCSGYLPKSLYHCPACGLCTKILRIASSPYHSQYLFSHHSGRKQ